MTEKNEIRSLGRVETRFAASETEGKCIGGYAAMFNSPTDICGCFIEQIAPGAFKAAIGRDDVRALFNHDRNYVLGRTKNKTLTLAEDATGLSFEAVPPDAQWAQDLVGSIQRGDITQCSFAFRSRKEEWDETGDLPKRTIIEAELIDVSVVTYPAYDDTSVGVRSLEDWRTKGALLVPNPALVTATRLRMKHALHERGLSRL